MIVKINDEIATSKSENKIISQINKYGPDSVNRNTRRINKVIILLKLLLVVIIDDDITLIYSQGRQSIDCGNILYN